MPIAWSFMKSVLLFLILSSILLHVAYYWSVSDFNSTEHLSTFDERPPRRTTSAESFEKPPPKKINCTTKSMYLWSGAEGLWRCFSNALQRIKPLPVPLRGTIAETFKPCINYAWVNYDVKTHMPQVNPPASGLMGATSLRDKTKRPFPPKLPGSIWIGGCLEKVRFTTVIHLIKTRLAMISWDRLINRSASSIPMVWFRRQVLAIILAGGTASGLKALPHRSPTSSLRAERH